METRKKKKVYLLGSWVSELCGGKLPSNRMVFGRFIHRHKVEKENTRTASKQVILEVMTFWEKARIPVRASQHSIKKLEKLFKEWTLLKKHKDRTTEAHKKKEAEFIDKLEDLFDIAHADALKLIKIPEDRKFLLAQREKGRRGVMGTVDKVLAAKERRIQMRAVMEQERRVKARSEQGSSKSRTVLANSSPSNSTTSSEENTQHDPNIMVKEDPSKPKRARKNIITPGLAAALDRTRISSRQATYILAEAVTSLGHDVADINVNRMSIHRRRKQQRSLCEFKLREEFTFDCPLVVHWDGKLMEDLTTMEYVDRLPIIISGNGISQLLGVPKIISGTGEAQASAVKKCLDEWGLCDRVKAMCFDTTASNTGHRIGACVLLEQKLKRNNILHLACRHHVQELLICTAFQKTLGGCSGPDILLFKRFKAQWSIIDKGKFQPAQSDEFVHCVLASVQDDLLYFAETQLKGRQVRDDYRELLELSVIFLGGVPSRGVRFMAPGAMHHARWMAKVLYALKIWMFRSEFKLTKREETGLRDIAIFSVRVYLKAWMTAPLAAEAPYNDFQLMQLLLRYANIHPEISTATQNKLASHLWYLSEELVGLAFFDKLVPSSMKRLMVQALQKRGTKTPPKRPKVDLKVFEDSSKTIEQFVTSNSMKLFKYLGLPSGFLSRDPDIWERIEEYQKAQAIVQRLQVVNDNAERGVALVQEFNKKLTKDEEQLQFLLRIVADHRITYPNSLKRTLAKPRPSLVR